MNKQNQQNTQNAKNTSLPRVKHDFRVVDMKDSDFETRLSQLGKKGYKPAFELQSVEKLLMIRVDDESLKGLIEQEREKAHQQQQMRNAQLKMSQQSHAPSNIIRPQPVK